MNKPDEGTNAHAQLLPCHFCGSSAQEEGSSEYGWLIETGDHKYWNGKAANSNGFTHIADDAVRFARFEDSERIIYWLMESYKVFLVSRQHKFIAALSQGDSSDPKSAPAVRSSLPSGESDPSVTLDCAGADTAYDIDELVEGITDENRHEEAPISMPGISAQVEDKRDPLKTLADNIQSKIAQLKHYRDNDCQLDHARTIADGRISQAEQIAQWVEAERQAVIKGER